MQSATDIEVPKKKRRGLHGKTWAYEYPKKNTTLVRLCETYCPDVVVCKGDAATTWHATKRDRRS